MITLARPARPGQADAPLTPDNTSLLEWIAVAKVERRACRALQRATALAPIRRGPDQYGQPWFGYVDRLRAEHAAARAALDAVPVSAPAAFDISFDTVDEHGWQRVLLDGVPCGAAVRITPSGNVHLSTPKHGRTTHPSVEAALGSWNFVGLRLDRHP
ncbi:hypothetical protein [Nocardia aurea]|uniref:hypothetical protein n=1 Tax=Nocardia aurea TaxID=2144174 RepID=UPI0033A7F72A